MLWPGELDNISSSLFSALDDDVVGDALLWVKLMFVAIVEFVFYDILRAPPLLLLFMDGEPNVTILL